MEALIKIKLDKGIQLTDQELAVKWWNNLPEGIKSAVLETYTPSLSIEQVGYADMYWYWLKQQTLTGPLFQK